VRRINEIRGKELRQLRDERHKLRRDQGENEKRQSRGRANDIRGKVKERGGEREVVRKKEEERERESGNPTSF
jgi:hypothetical protein